MAVTITRTPIIDDDKTGTTGTSLDNAWKQQFYDQIDGALAKVPGPVDGSGRIPVSALPVPIPDANLTSNVALKNIDNGFVPQTLAAGCAVRGANSSWYYIDTSAGVDQKIWRLLNYSEGTLRLESLNDANTAILASSIFYRGGTFASGAALMAATDVFEKARATPMGHWIPVPYNAATYTTAQGAWAVPAGTVYNHRYTLVGKTLIWSVYCTGTLSGGPSGAMYVAIPPGFAIPYGSAASGAINAGGVWGPALLTYAGGPNFTVYKSDLGAIPNGAVYVGFSVSLEFS